jgi:hypothetical protein
MTKLTDLQLILLSTASQRDDGSLLPPPDSVGERTPATDKAIQSLVRRGLSAELDTSDMSGPMPKNRDRFIGVRITAAGRAALGVGNKSDDPAGKSANSTSVPASQKKDTKASQVLAMPRRDSGATLDELVAATGWLPHTTRAALTGLRKKGHDLISEKIDGVRRYRVGSANLQAAAAQ